MPRARDMQVQNPGWAEMDTAAREERRVRIRGVVAAAKDGYSGTYRNSVLHVRTGGVMVRVTAGTTSVLGTARPGTEVDLVCTLTGLVDLTQGLYFAKRAQLITAHSPT